MSEINITSNGIVEYLGEREGQTWRTTIEPGDTAQAAELLTTEELARVQAAWTHEIVAAWQAQQAAIEAQYPVDNSPRKPTVEERLAALETEVVAMKRDRLTAR